VKRSVLNKLLAGFKNGCAIGSATEPGAMRATKLEASLFWNLSTVSQRGAMAWIMIAAKLRKARTGLA